ncbi:hypothetical protein M430DRAFT_70064, partial [Amorphotheca resinae ATCC 22711]
RSLATLILLCHLIHCWHPRCARTTFLSRSTLAALAVGRKPSSLTLAISRTNQDTKLSRLKWAQVRLRPHVASIPAPSVALGIENIIRT